MRSKYMLDILHMMYPENLPVSFMAFDGRPKCAIWIEKAIPDRLRNGFFVLLGWAIGLEPMTSRTTTWRSTN